ncbi:MAG: DHHA1 domain-containing protein [Candidatus Methanodesulfokora sp.]|mgnify:FL=1
MQPEVLGRIGKESIYKAFLEIADFLINGWRKGELFPVRIVVHNDADGLSSAAIISDFLSNMDVPHHISAVKYIEQNLIEELLRERYPLVIFGDIGSGYKSMIERIAERAKVIILDHHRPDKTSERIKDLNPFLFGINGDEDLSGAGVAYLLAEALGSHTSPHIPLIGALGDLQYSENRELSGVNKIIAEVAERKGIISIRNDLKLFGGPGYPLAAALERTVQPHIPGISGNSSAAISLLEKLGIPVKKDDKWTTLDDLSAEKKKELASELIRIIAPFSDPKEIIGKVYLLKNEEPASFLRDLRSFATVLNACGRMGRPDIGIMLARGVRKYLNEAVNILNDYRKEINDAITRYESSIRTVKGVAFVDGEGHVRDMMIGVVVSILSKKLPARAVIGYALSDGRIKISARSADKSIDLNEILKIACESAGGIGGGHEEAAGGLIPLDRKDHFEKKLIELL